MRKFFSRRDTGPVTVVPAAEPMLQHAHLDGVRSIELDYPFTPAVRWGGSLPPHPQLRAILDRGRDGDRDQLDAVAGQRDRLLEIPVHEVSADQPCWANGWLPGLDAAVLYTVLAAGNPATYLEVGSGNSTRFARRAITVHGLRTRIVSIDPEPCAVVDELCDEVVR